MADTNNTPKTVQMEVPPGYTPEQFAKLTASFVKQNQRGKLVGQAVAETIKRLKDAHKPEYRKILTEEYTKKGLDPSTIK